VSVRLREEIQEVLRRGECELNLQPENTLSIFRMIRSAHCTAAATTDSDDFFDFTPLPENSALGVHSASEFNCSF